MSAPLMLSHLCLILFLPLPLVFHSTAFYIGVKMPHTAKSHDDFMKIVCGVCTCKSKHNQKITPQVLDLIRRHHHQAYDVDKLPSIICKSCLPTLKELDSKGADARRFLPTIDYRQFEVPVRTRSAEANCSCGWCKVGRYNGVEYKRHEASVKNKVGRPSDKPQEQPNISICRTCMGEVAKGVSHHCTKTNRNENLAGLVRALSNEGSGRVTSKLINVRCEEEGIDKRTGSLTLSSGTKQLFINFGKRAEKPQLTYAEVINILNKTKLSNNQLKDVLAAIRVKFGRKSVEPNFRMELTKISKALAEFFSVKMVDVKYTNLKKKIDRTEQRPLVYLTDLEAFVNYILDARQMDPDNFCVMIGMDEGQNSIKIMMSIKEKVVVEKKMAKRMKYDEGIQGPDTLLSSVNRLFIIGLLPNTQESHHNLEVMLKELPLANIEHNLTADLKLVLSLIGKMSAACSNPCIYCESDSSFTAEDSPLLTIGSLKMHLEEYIEAGSDKKMAKLFQNVINSCLLDYPDETLLVDVICEPELHIVLGLVAKFISYGEKAVGKEKIDQYLRLLNITRVDYHGQNSLNGNDSMLFIENILRLSEVTQDIEDAESQEKLVALIDCVQEFEKVVASCFGQTLEEDYEKKISSFLAKYRSLPGGISVSLKVHLLSHIKLFLERKFSQGYPRCGLGFFSEQAFESCHSNFKDHWSKYKVGVDHASYKERLLEAVLSYNSRHI